MISRGSKRIEAQSPETIGEKDAVIPVELGTRFLEQFSEHLYSSPQKAFEELISNGWDAGADCVHVFIPDNLSAPNSSLCILDNGISMDADGLRLLWRVSFSNKKDNPIQFGRQVVGKFGIGKLATYVLAGKLTYLCKSTDGIIRRVTMDFGNIDNKNENQKLVSDLLLDIYKVSESDFFSSIESLSYGPDIAKLIRGGVPCPEGHLMEDEFGAESTAPKKAPSETWTLVILSDLKPAGRDLKIGILTRMLQAALPFGSEMAISVNWQLLSSSKLNVPINKEWKIGPALEIDFVQIPEETNDPDPTERKVTLDASDDPMPHVFLPGIGRVTGRVVLFEDKISGGKSDENAPSNGFHVNVLGRLINQRDPSFGEKDLSHAAWARFRMTVRADGLDRYLTTDRERFTESAELKLFRLFLRRVFNKIRTYYDNDDRARLPDGGDVLVKSLGVISLNPLRNVVADALGPNQAPLPDLFDEEGIPDREAKRLEWKQSTGDNIKDALGTVKYDTLDDKTFVKFRMRDNSIVVNKKHPFVEEYSKTKAEKELVRTVAMINFLTDLYALDIGVDPSALQHMRQYRDQLMRFRALERRESGTQIASLLLQTQADSANSKRMEAVVGDALEYLGYDVLRLGKSGDPEGIARAFSTPTNANPTEDNPTPPLYSFTYDAKSSKHDKAQTNNVRLDAVVEHRDRYQANYALVIAPGYSDGALATRCESLEITPITARDLGRLLEYTVEHGAIPLTKLREIFRVFDPVAVTSWTDELGTWLKAKRPLTIDIFLQALKQLKGQVPDALAASTLALECRRGLKAVAVRDEDVIALAKGLAILVPDLIGVDNDKIIVNASPDRVAAAVEVQLEKLHESASLQQSGKND